MGKARREGGADQRARGQGAAEAEAFAREGAKVIFGDIRDDEGKKVEAAIRAGGAEATYLHLDVTSEADWQKAVQAAIDRHQRPHVLTLRQTLDRRSRREYEEFTMAVWYILQTVTTVGYGAYVTPTEPIGRFIGGAVMLLAIASLSILTASITSAFIDARQAARREERETTRPARWAEANERLDDLVQRLDRLEGADRSNG